MCADCGISGRKTGTSCAAFTLCTAMTCVMSSSEPDFTRDGRSMFGICRAFASGTILMMPPDSTATNWCTDNSARNAS